MSELWDLFNGYKFGLRFFSVSLVTMHSVLPNFPVCFTTHLDRPTSSNDDICLVTIYRINWINDVITARSTQNIIEVNTDMCKIVICRVTGVTVDSVVSSMLSGVNSMCAIWKMITRWRCYTHMPHMPYIYFREIFDTEFLFLILIWHSYTLFVPVNKWLHFVGLKRLKPPLLHFKNASVDV